MRPERVLEQEKLEAFSPNPRTDSVQRTQPKNRKWEICRDSKFPMDIPVHNQETQGCVCGTFGHCSGWCTTLLGSAVNRRP